nr:hypothetical protein [Microseira wollei]
MAAGGISGYAKVEPKISGSLAGTAICRPHATRTQLL